MSKRTERPAEQGTIDLKDPALAAFLAWLLPGLGHWYQGRLAKGVLFFVCVMGTFSYGACLGGSSELGWARVVYASWTRQERRWPYLCQVCVGLPALPALVQANRARGGQPPLLHGFMAPPQPNENPHRFVFSRDTLHEKLHRFFELGTVYTMVAGLLNVLAIYDAWGGPVLAESAKKQDPQGSADGEGRNRAR